MLDASLTTGQVGMCYSVILPNVDSQREVAGVKQKKSRQINIRVMLTDLPRLNILP